VALADLLPCEALGPDGTELAGCAKLYLPFIDAPASQRPFAFGVVVRVRGLTAGFMASAYGSPVAAPRRWRRSRRPKASGAAR
jgi:hypothetical protein